MTDCPSGGERQGAQAIARAWTGRLFALKLTASRGCFGDVCNGNSRGTDHRRGRRLARGKIVHGAGFGLVGNIVVGIIGALVASWVLPQLHIGLATGTVGAIVDATIGAVIVLVILSLIKRV